MSSAISNINNSTAAQLTAKDASVRFVLDNAILAIPKYELVSLRCIFSLVTQRVFIYSCSALSTMAKRYHNEFVFEVESLEKTTVQLEYICIGVVLAVLLVGFLPSLRKLAVDQGSLQHIFNLLTGANVRTVLSKLNSMGNSHRTRLIGTILVHPLTH